jgi:hypothetical protein
MPRIMAYAECQNTPLRAGGKKIHRTTLMREKRIFGNSQGMFYQIGCSGEPVGLHNRFLNPALYELWVRDRQRLVLRKSNRTSSIKVWSNPVTFILSIAMERMIIKRVPISHQSSRRSGHKLAAKMVRFQHTFSAWRRRFLAVCQGQASKVATLPH